MRLVITGGAGFIGSVVASQAQQEGFDVTVVDDLRFGGEALLPWVGGPRFRLLAGDVRDGTLLAEAFRGADAAVHLAALVGFPACQSAGRDEVWAINVGGTRAVYSAARSAGVRRLVFASSYSNYGKAETDTGVVSEDSPLIPLSIYAESKVDAEQYLLNQSAGGAPPQVVCLRLSTVFGLSPRTRFDLMVNQFVLEAFSRRRLIVYQQDFRRSFVHVRDVARAILTVITAHGDSVSGEVFNIGSEKLNTTKSFLVQLVRRRWPDIEIEERSLDFAGDMRSLHVSFAKARRVLGFDTALGLDDGVEELAWALEKGVIGDPWHEKYRNHKSLIP